MVKILKQVKHKPRRAVLKLDSGKLYDKLYARYTLLRLQKDSSVSNADPLEPRSKGVVAEASGHPVFDPTLAALPPNMNFVPMVPK